MSIDKTQAEIDAALALINPTIPPADRPVTLKQKDFDALLARIANLEGK